MAFLYADPIVRVNKFNKIVPVDTPLDLMQEYKLILRSLRETKKEFKIIK